MAEYIINTPFGEKKYHCPDKCCLTCGHCTDVFWDYTNGPYMVTCEVKDEPQFVDCEDFEEEQ